MPEFSIIIPIYNVEKYLRTCVDSILSQSFKDFEVILVDDGSPDACGEICDQYKEKDLRVTVIHKKNGGLSSARNAGLDVAKGKYIIFVDSDDYWNDRKALEHFFINLSETEADLLVFPAKRYYEDTNEFTNILNIDIERKKIIISDKFHAIKYMLENNVYRAAAWNKVIKKRVIDDNSMRFREGYLSEDMDWCGNLLLFCVKFDFYEKPIYVYRQQRSGSITSGKTEKLVSDKLFFCKKGYEQAMKLEDKNESKLLASYYAYEYAVTLGVSSGIKDKKILRDMRSLNVLLNYDICNKVKKVKKLRNFIGFNSTRKVLCLFVKIKR